MEPVSIPAERSAKKGSLEDPEVLQNVPGHVIPILQREYDDFKTEATKFLQGDMPEDEFIKFRLRQGVYGQRQPDVQMIRVKLPFGGVTPEQMDKFADVVEKYAPLGKGHVTTRQNIQMHHIPLPEIEQAIREMGEAGLSSREGCGNTGAQRHRRSLGRGGRGRAVRPHPLCRCLCALLRQAPHHTGDAAQDQDLLRRLARATGRSAASTTSPSARASSRSTAKRYAARRCSSAAAPRSCRVWLPRCTTSWSSTTATT